MRWFVVFLVLANLILFFWMQREERAGVEQASLPPPDVGRLELLKEPPPKKVVSTSPIVASKPLGNTRPERLTPTPELVKAEVSPESVEVPKVALTAPEPPVEKPAPVVPKAVDRRSAVMPSLRKEKPVIEAVPTTGSTPAPKTQEAPKAPPVAVPPRALAMTAQTDPVSAAPAEGPACYRVGPLRDKHAETLLANLPAFLTLVSDTTEETETVNGYYVMYPPLPTRAAGIAKIKELREAGFDDTLLLRRKEHANAISMGVFSRLAIAQRHADNVLKRGFPVEIRPRSAKAERRWLKLERRDGSNSVPDLPLPRGASTTPVSCP